MFAAFQRILVALDGRQGGLDAIALAARLAQREAELAIGHVLPDEDRGAAGRAGELEAAIARARSVFGVARDEPGALDLPVLTAHRRSVLAGLRALVADHGADLLVLGAHHHRHFHLPSRDHTRAAVRELPCAVAVAPSGYAKRPLQRVRSIGVGYVDDRGGRLVLDLARDLAWQLDAEVHATMVVGLSNWEDAESLAGWRAVAAAKRMAEIPGVHGEAVEGDAQRALADLSRHVDLLVIGSHHHGALRRVLPDVATHLSHEPHCPLVVLPQRSDRN